MSNNSSSKIFPSTMPKSISLPQIRSDGNRLNHQGNSTSSVKAVFMSSTPNDDRDDHEFGSSADGPSTEIVIIKSVVNKSSKKERHVHFSEGLSPAVCRICHGGEMSCPFDGEPLISPCHCSGSMGLYHRACLEKWLSTANRDKCEICKFQYLVERRPKSWTEFMRNPGSSSIRRNMIGDTLCLLILTPMAIASCWLCIAGAAAVAETGTDAIAVPGLISLAVFLLLTYFVWFSISLRYHFQIWMDWRRKNQNIHLVTPKDQRGDTIIDFDDNNNASPTETIQLQTLADIRSRRSTDTLANAYDSPWPTYDYPNPSFAWETMV